MVRAQMEEVRSFLDQAVLELNGFLNTHTIDHLMVEEGSKNKDYYHTLLKTLRRLSVFCDEAYDAVQVILQSEVFRKPAAEKTLHGIYHQCIMEFYAPKGDTWYEDSRAAYTGKNAIQYQDTPPYSVKTLILSLEKSFQEIREELAYYETDYRTKMVMNNDSEASPS